MILGLGVQTPRSYAPFDAVGQNLAVIFLTAGNDPNSWPCLTHEAESSLSPGPNRPTYGSEEGVMTWEVLSGGGFDRSPS